MFWVAWGIAPINSSTSQTRIGFGVLYIVVRKIFMAIKLCLYNWDGNPSVHPTLGSRFWVRALSVFWLNLIDLVVAYASQSMIWMFFRLGSLFEMKLIFCPIYVRRNWRLLWLIVFLSMTGMVSLWFSFETKVLFLPCDMWRIWSLSWRIVFLEHNRNCGLVSLLSLTLSLWRTVVLKLNSTASFFSLFYLIWWF